jgi:hypothetical protein
MSRENVELVGRLYPAGDVDVGRLFSHDPAWAAFAEAFGYLFHPGFESSASNGFAGATGVGFDGLRRLWLDWLAPWATYRTEVEEAIDCGDRVLVLVNNFGRLEASGQEVKHVNAAVWTVRDGRIASIEGYTDPAEALKAVGLI